MAHIKIIVETENLTISDEIIAVLQATKTNFSHQLSFAAASSTQLDQYPQFDLAQAKKFSPGKDITLYYVLEASNEKEKVDNQLIEDFAKEYQLVVIDELKHSKYTHRVNHFEGSMKKKPQSDKTSSYIQYCGNLFGIDLSTHYKKRAIIELGVATGLCFTSGLFIIFAPPLVAAMVFLTGIIVAALGFYDSYNASSKATTNDRPPLGSC